MDTETDTITNHAQHNYQYQLSLSSVMASSPAVPVPSPNDDAAAAAAAVVASSDDNNDDDDDDENRNNGDAHTNETPSLKYPQYREYSNQVLKDYIYKRYIPGSADTSSDDHGDAHDDQTDGAYYHHDAARLVASPGQNQEPESQSGWTTTYSTTTRAPMPKIPLVHDTLHVVHGVSQIDMYTKSLHLSLCRLEKVWPLRLSKRAAMDPDSVMRPSNRNNNNDDDDVSKAPLPLFPFGRYEDDGPLFCAYKNVMTLELAQLDAPHAMLIHQTASNADPQGKLYRRVRVYLYNRYAKLANDFIQKHANCSFYCRLANIPAACIFPYQRSQQGWFDDHVSDYVLCIGDKSQCQTGDGNGRMYFEHVDLQIHLLAVPHDPTKPWNECILDPCHATQQSEPKDSSLLVAALQSWNEGQEHPRPNVTHQSIRPSSSFEAAIPTGRIGVNVGNVVDTNQEDALVRPAKRVKLKSTLTQYKDLVRFFGDAGNGFRKGRGKKQTSC